jgi:hypothetical protein
LRVLAIPYIVALAFLVKPAITPTDLQKSETKKTCGIDFSIQESPG